MKKLLLATSALFLFCFIAISQESKSEKLQGNFLAVTAGPAFPFGDFSSTDLNNTASGSAKTGFTVDINYAHQFQNGLGLAITGLYGRHSVDKKFVSEVGNVSIDPWQFYGLMIGPMASTSVSPVVRFDLSALTGITYTTSPRVSHNGQVVMDNDWSAAVPLRLAADFKFDVSNSAFLSLGGNYLYMKPKFTTSTSSGDRSFRQPMSIFGVNAGIGLRF
jgi:hypothetical protein